MALGGEFQEQLNNLRYTFASALTTGSRALINNWSLLIRLKSSLIDYSTSYLMISLITELSEQLPYILNIWLLLCDVVHQLLSFKANF